MQIELPRRNRDPYADFEDDVDAELHPEFVVVGQGFELASPGICRPSYSNPNLTSPESDHQSTDG
jgi:hypothetical protein